MRLSGRIAFGIDLAVTSMLVLRLMVGERGFEPPAPASRRQCSTRLSYSPTGTRECDAEVAAGAKAAAR